MATDLDRPRKKRHISDSPDDLSTPEKREKEAKMLKSFTERDDILRSLITCKICFRPLYEPFTNECGHTYCYSCLCQWFKSAPTRRKTCPDCRTKLNQAPTPAYALRDLTREMIQRAELLPADESLEGHRAAQQEELRLVERDKSSTANGEGGLFGGCFNSLAPKSFRIRDDEDGVYRCPECAWELEGIQDACDRCGALFITSDTGESSIGSAEFDGDLDDYDEEINWSLRHVFDDEAGYDGYDGYSSSSGTPGTDHHFFDARYGNYGYINSDDDDDEDEDEENGANQGDYPREDASDENTSLDGFVVSDEDEEENEDKDTGNEEDAGGEYRDSDVEAESLRSTTRNRSSRIPTRSRYTVIDSDDEEGSAKESAATTQSNSNLDSSQTHVTRIEPDINNENHRPARRTRQRRRRRLDSDDSE